VQSELDRGVDDPALEPDRRHAAAVATRLTARVESERDPGAFDSLVGELTRIEARVAP
jgi:hypothetical protein